MKAYFRILIIGFSVVGLLALSDSVAFSDEISELKEQIKLLMERVEKLEKERTREMMVNTVRTTPKSRSPKVDTSTKYCESCSLVSTALTSHQYHLSCF